MVHCLIDHTNQYTEEVLEKQPCKARDYVVVNNDARQKLVKHPMLGWIISIATPNVCIENGRECRVTAG